MDAAALEWIGYLTVLFLAARLSRWSCSLAYRRWLARPLNPAALGPWALVTGATDGIGKAYAFALAKRGCNVVLVSRSPFKLQNVAADIESKFGVKTKIIDIDFTATDDAVYCDRLRKEIEGLQIGTLVNNVGMSYDRPERFLDIEGGLQAVRAMVACNVTTVNALTSLVLPGMVERRRGAVVNVSSLSGTMTTPLLTVYSATKAYVAKFSAGLEYEYRGRGVAVQCVFPGHVTSKLSKIRHATVAVPTPEIFVKSALSRLGIDSDTCGYWVHDAMLGALNLLPAWAATKVVYGQLASIRARALKKKMQVDKKE